MRSEPLAPESRVAYALLIKRAVALVMCELIVLQPVLAAPLSQLPMFTVTSVPPNVMLTFDDSASMQLLTLTPSAAYANATMSLFYPLAPATSRQPVLKVNTAGYYGASGMRWYHSGNALYDNRWNFGINEVKQRSAAFNPLAYNPAVQYRPWNNNNGLVQTNFGNASYGGSGDVAAGGLTEWDMRNLPTSMGGGTVRSKTAPNMGNLPSGSTLRSWAGPPAGSVRYQGPAHGPANPVTATAPVGTDLFTSTIAFKNPDCGTTTSTPNYAWKCNAGTGITPAPAETCNAGNLDQQSLNNRQCCTATSSSSSSAWQTLNYLVWRNNPPGSPPALVGPGGETCTVSYTGSTQVVTGLPPCSTVDPPPFVAPCPGNGGELCITDPPPVTTCTGTATQYRWKCDYDKFVTTTTNTCTATELQYCRSPSSTTTCNGVPIDPTTDAQYDSGYWPPARYVVYNGPATRTQAEIEDLSNYRMVMIDRKFGWNGASRDLIGTNLSDAVSKWFVVDGATGMPSYRRDCDAPPFGTGNAGQDGTWCTFEQEAQNYANWFTYYRSRLYAAIAVMSEVLSGFSGPEQYMRLGFGRINYFKGGLNQWNVNSVTDIPYPGALPSLDGATNEGAVVRGVRPFTVFDPPLTATPNTARQEIFDNLFSMNGLGPTPNRETMNAIGQYFRRSDSKGPWGLNPGAGAEPVANHLWCRRNYTVMATDGEWTKLPVTFGFKPQPLLENGADWSQDPATLGVTTSMSATGAPIAGTNRLTNAPLSFTYDPTLEPQITGGSGSQTGTLTDVMHYYWSRDLRPDLRNSLDPTPTNRAFWQHMATYVVGYGVRASMESPTLRPEFQAQNLIAWPTVGLESCRQLDDNVQDAALPPPACTAHSVSPSGNRINDTLRAALSSHGDFFSAQSPAQLKASLDAVFAAIQAENAAGTAPAFSSPSVAAGGVLVQSGFRTNIWDGYVLAYDTKAYVDFLAGRGPLPPAVWSANFDTPATRKIVTSTDQSTAVDFQWCNLTAAQQTDLDPIAPGCPSPSPQIVDYLRGDQSKERRFGVGVFRDRPNTILGDIVNSSPLYSKAGDYAYRFSAAAAFSGAPPHGYASYPAYVQSKKTTRTATLMFGANDGMFHMLDARIAQPTSGKEIFAYVPRAVYPRLRELADPAYSHKYTVDGPLVEGDVWNGGAWKTVVVGSTGAGPAGLFAIDVTAPEGGMTAANVLWDIVPADHASATVQQHLGNVMGLGVIGSVKLDGDSTPATTPNGKWAFITGNGYESAGNQATLLVFDVMTGALIRAIQTGVGSAGSPNGLGAVAPVYDGARNIVAAYAGDRLGNLWKFDLSSDDPANWKIANEQPLGTPKPLFAAGPSMPIHQEPRVTEHPLGGLYVAFGTGKLHEVGDAADLSGQALFVVWDKGQQTPVVLGDLERIRLEEYTVGADTYRRLRAPDLAGYDWNDKGFWIPLRAFGQPANGERIIAPMVLDLGVLSVTSYSPENGTDQCIPGGTSFLYKLDLSGRFGHASFGSEGATTVGFKVTPGTAGAMEVLHVAATAGVTKDSMDTAGLTAMLKTAKYRMTSSQAVSLGTAGECQNVGLRVDGTFARIPVNCVGMLPMRTWRPIR